MSQYGFNFEPLRHLELETLYEICQFIRDDNSVIAPDYDVIIRGWIIPTLRDGIGVSGSVDKDEIMRVALIATAEKIGIYFDNWETADTNLIASATQNRAKELIRRKFETLIREEQDQVLKVAKDKLRETAKSKGVPISEISTIIDSNPSGYEIYLTTSTGLKALSFALDTTFAWGVAGAATILVIFGPIGWAIAGISFLGSATLTLHKWAEQKKQHQLMLLVISLLFAIGENPFEFFGLPPDASLKAVKKTYGAVLQAYHPDKIAAIENNLPQWIKDEFTEKTLRCIEAKEKFERLFDQKMELQLKEIQSDH